MLVVSDCNETVTKNVGKFCCVCCAIYTEDLGITKLWRLVVQNSHVQLTSQLISQFCSLHSVLTIL